MYIEQTDSTNSLMQRLLRGEESEYAACLKDEIPFIYTGYQSLGRGQTGNGWESEEGKNLLLTYLLRQPEVEIAEQFRLNMIAAIATHRAISECLNIEQRPMLTIKWPNDIYIGSKKIAGILVENSLMGDSIQHSIAGVGINVNQEKWIGNAPNPTSIKLMTGSKVDVDHLMQIFMKKLTHTLPFTYEQLRVYYMNHLYRNDGYYPFVEREVSTQPTMNASKDTEGQFMARILDVLPTGELLLKDQQGQQRIYHFKQVRYVV